MFVYVKMPFDSSPSQLSKDFNFLSIISIQSSEEMNPDSKALVFVEAKETVDDLLSIQKDEENSAAKQDEVFSSPLTDREWVTNPNYGFIYYFWNSFCAL